MPDRLILEREFVERCELIVELSLVDVVVDGVGAREDLGARGRDREEARSIAGARRKVFSIPRRKIAVCTEASYPAA